jgi:hypothetical protein
VSKLRDAARDQICVVPGCGSRDDVVLAHYFGPRRHSYGGGLSIKGHDLIGAHLCAAHHAEMDTLLRDKDRKWEHSEQFLHYCALTLIRLWDQGVIR